MVTKRKLVSEPERTPDALRIERSSFKSMLGERITFGKNLLERSITSSDQLTQLRTDFYKWNDFNSEYLKQSFNNERNAYKSNYDSVNQFLGVFGGYGTSPAKEYQRLLDQIENKIRNLEELVDKIDLLKSAISEQPAIKKGVDSNSANENVFIVHGHDTTFQQSVARVIEKLGLHPIILHEQPNNGKTIIEKFEKHSEVGFAIILMTADDEGKSKSEIDLKNRARQNVILELGYFIGKLGRERVLPLYSDGVELPSDIHGLLYTPLDKSENWKFAIVKELKEAGYTVDANNIL